MKNSNEVHLAACNVTVANSKMSTESGTTKRREFDEWKLSRLANIEKIIVNSNVADVHMSSAKVSAIEVHLSGKAHVDGDIRLCVRHEGIELKVAVEVEGVCYLSNLRLDIIIPKTKYKTLSISTDDRDICIENEDVLTYKLEVSTVSGKIDIEKGVCVKRILLTSVSGDVFVNHVHGNERLMVKTLSGNITIGTYVWSSFLNIKTESGSVEMVGSAAEDASVQTTSGKIVLCEGFFVKKINIKSITGNITLSAGDASVKLEIETVSGNISATMVSNNTRVNTNSGNVSVHLDAEQDIKFDIATNSGNVKTCFEHVKALEVHAKSLRGLVKNYFQKSFLGHKAEGNISSVSGMITIK